MKVREQQGRLFCWKCNSELQIDMASATPLIAQLPEDERVKMGAALLQAAADAECRAKPNFDEALHTKDLDAMKAPWFHVVRESVRQGDAGSLSLIAAWFLLEADRKQMLRFIYAMEHDEEEQTSGEVIEFPKSA